MHKRFDMLKACIDDAYHAVWVAAQDYAIAAREADSAAAKESGDAIATLAEEHRIVVAGLESEIERRRQHLGAASVGNDRLRADMGAANASLFASHEKQAADAETIAGLEAEIAKANNDARAGRLAAEAEIRRLHSEFHPDRDAELNRTNRYLREAEMDVRDLRAELASAHEAARRLRDRLDSNADANEARRLSSDLAHAEALLANERDMVASLSTDLDLAQAALADRVATLATVRATLANEEAARVAAAGVLAKTRDAYSSLAAEHNAASAELAKARTEISRLSALADSALESLANAREDQRVSAPSIIDDIIRAVLLRTLFRCAGRA